MRLVFILAINIWSKSLAKLIFLKTYYANSELILKSDCKINSLFLLSLSPLLKHLKMKIFYASVLFIIFYSSAYAQSDFRKGYVVKLNGDTLDGYVNFQNEFQNFTTCNFKRFQIAIPVNYAPGKIKAYGIINGKQYLSCHLDGVEVFAEYLVRGEYSLLFYKKGGQHFYFNDKGGCMVELKSGKIIDQKSSQSYSNYKEYLSNKMSNLNVTDLINDSQLEINSLTIMVKRFNEVANAPYEIPLRPKEKNMVLDYHILGTNKLQFGLLGGGNIFNFKNSTTKEYDFIGKARFNSYVSPMIGLFVKGNISRYHPHLILESQVLYHKVSLYGYSKYSYASSYTDIYYNDLFISYKSLCMRGIVNYSINISNLKILPHVGIGYAFYLNSSYNRFYQIYKTAFKVMQSYEYSDLKIKKNDFLYIAGISFEYQLTSARIISLNFDSDFGTKILDLGGSKSKTRSYNISLGLTL
jgi:hypothetical protein